MNQALTYQDMPEIQEKRWKIFLVLMVFTLMASLDGGVIGVSLPAIAVDLGVTASQVSWVAASYLMSVCSFIIFAGKLGDSIGKVKVFKLGIYIFVVGTFLSGLASSLILLVTFKIIQGLGGAMAMASNMAIITEVFPKEERGKALGLLGIFLALGSIIGPAIGGVIVSSLGWNFVFWLNVPIGILLILFGLRILPDDLHTSKLSIDILGNILFISFIVSLLVAIINGQNICFIISIISLIAFIIVERKVSNPMVKLSMFKNVMFSVSISIAFFSFLVNFIYQIVTPFYVQDFMGISPTNAGFIMMIIPVTMAISGPISGTLSDKFNAQIITLIGLIVSLIANIGLSMISLDSTVFSFCILTALLGLGNGIFQSPNNSIVMSSVEKNQLGLASGINALMRNLGQAVGIGLGTTILFFAMSKNAGYTMTALDPDKPEIFIHGIQFTYMISTILCIIGICLVLFRLFSTKKNKTSN